MSGSKGRAAAAAGTIATAHLMNDALTSMFPALLPLIAQRLDITGATVAALVAVFAISTSLPQPVLGAFADRIGPARIVSAGLLVSAALVSALAFVQSPAVLSGLLLVGGLGSAAVHPAGVGLAGRVSADNRATAMAIFAAGGMVGGGLGPVIALTIVAIAGVQALVWMLVPTMLVAAAVQWIANPWAAAAAPGVAHGTPAALLTNRMLTLAIVGVFAALPFVTIVNSLPLWLVQVHGLPANAPIIGYALATFSAAAALGGIFAGIASRRMARATIVTATLLAAIPAVLMLVLLDPRSVAFFIVLAIAGAAIYGHLPLLVARAQELAPGRESAAAGVTLGLTWAGAGIIYIGVGWLQQQLAFSIALALPALGLLPAAALAARAFRPQPETHVIAPRWACACGPDDLAVAA